jgi:hypothetical protein
LQVVVNVARIPVDTHEGVCRSGRKDSRKIISSVLVSLWQKARQFRTKKLTLALFHTIEGVFHRHVLQIRMFNKDEELSDFLTKIVLSVVENP